MMIDCLRLSEHAFCLKQASLGAVQGARVAGRHISRPLSTYQMAMEQ